MDGISGLNKQQQQIFDLANTHLEHDLSPSDRDALKRAGTTLATHTWFGSAIGTSLGLALALRGRSNLHRAFVIMKKAPKPTEVIMETGEHVKVPQKYLNNLEEPGALSTFFSCFFLGTLGLLAGSSFGTLTGSYSAKKTVEREVDLARLKNAYRLFRIDLLKKEVAELENSTAELPSPFWS